jgi:hypothetical protein
LCLEALANFINYHESMAEKLRKLKASERRYRRTLLAWAPLPAWVATNTADPDDADDEASVVGA